MKCMFNNCEALTSLNLSSNFNTSKVTNMTNMFSGLHQLTSLDLSSFNTATAANTSQTITPAGSSESITANGMYSMFYDSTRLNTVTLGADFEFPSAYCTLPAPSSTYTSGADGKWYDTTTRVGYTPANLVTYHNNLNQTRTYKAVL